MLKKRAFKKPEKPESLEVLVAQYDAAARDAAVSWRSALFDHTPPTLSVLDEMLEELHGQYTQKSFKKRLGLGTSDIDVAQWANLWGIYAGETIRLELGGKWITGHEEAPTLLAVELPDGTVLFPTARVFRRITDGAAESVAEYYRKVMDVVGGTRGEPSSQ